MDDRINSAISALDSQKGLSIRAATNKYRVNRTTLGRRYNGESQSRAAATSAHHQNLTDVEEDTLIGYINSLTDRHIPPTSQIVRNLTEKLISRPVDKNWTGQFLKRHSQRLYNVYLRSLDRKHVFVESLFYFNYFYVLILLYL